MAGGIGRMAKQELRTIRLAYSVVFSVDMYSRLCGASSVHDRPRRVVAR